MVTGGPKCGTSNCLRLCGMHPMAKQPNDHARPIHGMRYLRLPAPLPPAPGASPCLWLSSDQRPKCSNSARPPLRCAPGGPAPASQARPTLGAHYRHSPTPLPRHLASQARLIPRNALFPFICAAAARAVVTPSCWPCSSDARSAASPLLRPTAACAEVPTAVLARCPKHNAFLRLHRRRLRATACHPMAVFTGARSAPPCRAARRKSASCRFVTDCAATYQHPFSEGIPADMVLTFS